MCEDNPTDRDLRMLFFPTSADYESGHLRPAIDGQWFDKYSLPRLRHVDIGIKVDKVTCRGLLLGPNSAILHQIEPKHFVIQSRRRNVESIIFSWLPLSNYISAMSRKPSIPERYSVIISENAKRDFKASSGISANFCFFSPIYCIGP